MKKNKVPRTRIWK